MGLGGRLGLVALLLVMCIAICGGRPLGPAVHAQTSGNAINGRQLYSKMSCQYCHGTEGQGSLAGFGPRIATVQRNFESFARYVREPTGRMTGYSEKILPESDLRDIYAFLRSLPAAKPVAEIPLLDQLRKR